MLRVLRSNNVSQRTCPALSSVLTASQSNRSCMKTHCVTCWNSFYLALICKQLSVGFAFVAIDSPCLHYVTRHRRALLHPHVEVMGASAAPNHLEHFRLDFTVCQSGASERCWSFTGSCYVVLVALGMMLENGRELTGAGTFQYISINFLVSDMLQHCMCIQGERCRISHFCIRCVAARSILAKTKLVSKVLTTVQITQ